jgi:hypothetical protein
MNQYIQYTTISENDWTKGFLEAMRRNLLRRTLTHFRLSQGLPDMPYTMMCYDLIDPTKECHAEDRN